MDVVIREMGWNDEIGIDGDRPDRRRGGGARLEFRRLSAHRRADHVPQQFLRFEPQRRPVPEAREAVQPVEYFLGPRLMAFAGIERRPRRPLSFLRSTRNTAGQPRVGPDWVST